MTRHLAPFAELCFLHLQTKFESSSSPPRTLGTMWSHVSGLDVLPVCPQSTQQPSLAMMRLEIFCQATP